ncbi:MAG: DUF4336 domain-containing protein [Sandaracinaceae bacterium]|nr:DUF4336 domain-containing protein [Sandaracinaceae bacterium]
MTTDIHLTPLADGVFGLESSLRVVPGFHLPVRCTVLRLRTGGLMLISPLAITDALAAELEQLGPVEHLVAPNRLHHLFLDQAVSRWPQAQVHLAPGLPEKLAKLRRPVPAHSVLPDGLPDDVTGVLLAGTPMLGECLLFHPASKTLVVTDFVFHVREPKGLLTGLILRAVGARGVFAQSSEVRHMMRDKPAAAASAREVLALDFTRVVMAHGDVVEVKAKPRLHAALEKMLRAGER